MGGFEKIIYLIVWDVKFVEICYAYQDNADILKSDSTWKLAVHRRRKKLDSEKSFPVHITEAPSRVVDRGCEYMIFTYLNELFSKI
jgi:hypothetical protein